MNEKDRIRLQHMLEAAGKAELFISGKERKDLDDNEQLCLAVTRLVEIVGEAAWALSEEFKEEHHTVPWRAIIGARNRLVHGYFDVDYDILWNILARDLPQLANSIRELLD